MKLYTVIDREDGERYRFIISEVAEYFAELSGNVLVAEAEEVNYKEYGHAFTVLQFISNFCSVEYTLMIIAGGTILYNETCSYSSHLFHLGSCKLKAEIITNFKWDGILRKLTIWIGV